MKGDNNDKEYAFLSDFLKNQIVSKKKRASIKGSQDSQISHVGSKYNNALIERAS
jgi:hypothetical protein